MFNLSELEKKALSIRRNIVTMLVSAASGHAAGALGMADVFSALYFYLLKHNPKHPDWEGRDRLILSCGHICPVLYATLAEAGYFPKDELLTLRQLSSRLPGHPSLNSLPGVENSSGPLGQGVSLATGVAMAARLDNNSWRTVCITSDGEQQEGQVWEAYLFAAKYKLDNLVFILDRNDIQISGFTEEVLPLEPLKLKYEAFGLSVLEVDGHSFEEIIDAYLKAKVLHGKPTMIIARTIPGKGVEFMENKPEWHGKALSLGEGVKALRNLRLRYNQDTYD
ncbi:MAG: transketolase [Patescibacteria group bacterium]|jgi:transketolase